MAGGLAWDDYARYLGTKEVDDLCDRIEVWNDPQVEGLYPQQMSGSVDVTTASGRFSTLVDVPSGEPARFPDRSAQLAKFTGLAEPFLAPGMVEQLSTGILAMASADSVRGLFEMSRPARTAVA